MLLLDSHSSHYILELVKLAAKHHVVIFCLPPHTTADSSSHLNLTGLMFVTSICLHIQVK